MGRYLLSGLFLLAFGALNAFAAENLEKKTAVGLGEVCDQKIGPLCAKLVWCVIRRSLARPEYARTSQY